mmetsp:Transcript_60237/g.82605  ORF Transcript_60237/g.82605 Transcript_60237/m.82605 type:complete len:223 (-) Transcript_60237:341-1009(-)
MSSCWFCGDGRLPVALVNEYSSKISDEVDDTKSDSVEGEHREVRAMKIVSNRATRVFSCLVKSFTICIKGSFAFICTHIGHCLHHIIDNVARVYFDVHRVHEHDENDEDNGRMDVRSHECCFQTTSHRIRNHENRDQKPRRNNVHSCESIHGRSSPKNQHSCYDSVCEEAEIEEGDVSCCTPPYLDHLTNGVRLLRACFKLNGENTKEENLHSRTRRVPEGS